jgi:protein phosphatase
MRSDVGRVRSLNEDATLVMPGAGVFAVADGMGGHNAGDVASKLAVESLRNRLRGRVATPTALQSAVQETNLTLLRRAQSDEACSGMGTTLTLLWMAKDGALIGHVGDSRAYRYRDGMLRQCTEDHSVVAELVRQGALTQEEARVHPYRNVITRALGTAGYVEVDVVALDVAPGDRFLLCSDGLTGMVSDEHIEKTLSAAPTLDAAADALLAAALKAGGRDNITLLLMAQDEEVGA